MGLIKTTVLNTLKIITFSVFLLSTVSIIDNADAQSDDATNRPIYVNLTNNVAAIPAGIYVMVRSSQIFDKKITQDELTEILKVQSVTGLSLGLHFDCFFPTSRTITTEPLDQLMKIIDHSRIAAGRSSPVPILLKLYPILPQWMSTNIKEGITRNKVGIEVLVLPNRVVNTGKRIQQREYPIPTGSEYNKILHEIIFALGDWLEQFDPQAQRIPFVHYLGPGINSNTMRPLVENDLDKKYSYRSILDFDRNTFLQAWRKPAQIMSRHKAYSKRAWVFNLTNIAKQPSKKAVITNADQIDFVKYLETMHPGGPDAILLKSEDLTSYFKKNIVQSKYSRWRYQYNKKRKGNIYKHIAQRSLKHGWETWASFDKEKDIRASFLVPFNELIENSLYTDLNSSTPSNPQGTIWIEVWPEGIAHNILIQVSKNSKEKLQKILLKWKHKLINALCIIDTNYCLPL